MAPSEWPFGIYPPGGLARLSRHVVAYYAAAGPMSNSAIVRGRDATLVFDPNVIRFARILRAAVDADGPPLRDLVISHAHSDHAYGIAHFVPPAAAWTRRYVRDRLEYWSGEGLAQHVDDYRQYGDEFGAEILAEHVVVPQHFVEEATTIELGGGVRVQLRPEAEAHTVADLWAIVEPDGVVLCGDLWFNDCEPYFGSGSLAGSLTALQHLREAGAATYLPGHGPAGPLRGPEADGMERLIRAVGPDVGGPRARLARRRAPAGDPCRVRGAAHLHAADRLRVALARVPRGCDRESRRRPRPGMTDTAGRNTRRRLHFHRRLGLRIERFLPGVRSIAPARRRSPDSIVRALAEAQGGRAGVDPTPGRGESLRVELPTAV